MELYDSLGNLLLTVVIPTHPPIIIGINQDFPIPPIGGDFLFNFNAFIEKEEHLGRINYLLETGGLTVGAYIKNILVLHHGLKPGVEKPDASLYMNDYYKYWYRYQIYSPYPEFPDPEMGIKKLIIKANKEIRFEVPSLYPVPMPGGKLEINYAKVLDSKDLRYVENLTEKEALYCFKYEKNEIWFQLGIPAWIKPNFSQSEQNRHYSFYWTRNPEYAPEYWLTKPFVLTYPSEPDIRIEVPGGERIFIPGITYQINWKKFLPPEHWERIKEELEEYERYADEWIDTKTVIHGRCGFNPDLWF